MMLLTACRSLILEFVIMRALDNICLMRLSAGTDWDAVDFFFRRRIHVVVFRTKVNMGGTCQM